MSVLGRLRRTGISGGSGRVIASGATEVETPVIEAT